MLMVQNKNVLIKRHLLTVPALSMGGFFNTQGVQTMLFKKKRLADLPPLLSEAEITGANYEQVLDFLVAINEDDYTKVLKVADIYRKANLDVAQATGMDYQVNPSIFEQIDMPAVRETATMPTDTEAGNFLTDDDEINAAFLDDEPATPITVKNTTTEKTPKNENANLQS